MAVVGTSRGRPCWTVRGRPVRICAFHCGESIRAIRTQERGGIVTARRWDDVKAEAMGQQPWLASAEAETERAGIRAENLGRVRGHELAEMRKSAGLSQAEVAMILRSARHG